MLPMNNRTRQPRGLSVVEVLLVIATVVLLAAVFWPKMARPTKGGSRVSCTSNLKQIGLACRLWSNDNNDEFPWVSTNAAGSRAFVNSQQVFLHFAAMSNELVSPKVLICPSDTKRKRVQDFSNFSNREALRLRFIRL